MVQGGPAINVHATNDAWPTLDWLANKKQKKEKKVEEPPAPVVISPSVSAKVIIEEAKVEEPVHEADQID
jgi:hypothetical protein